jgi:hypothetical protein
MANLNQILEISNEYLNAHDRMNARFLQWTTNGTFEVVRSTLNKIVQTIQDQNDYFKSNLYVVGEVPLQGVSLKSGKMPYPLTDGEIEQGFQIHFEPLANGKIHVYAIGHEQRDRQNYHTLEVISDLSEISDQKVIDLVYDGLKIVKNTSFLFIAESSEQ